MPPVELLDPARLAAPDLERREPFPFVVVEKLLPETAINALASDFPRYREAGFFPHDTDECGATVNTLIAEATAPEFADALGQRLGIERLSQYPTLVTICRALNRRHGTIHTDSRSKVVTALIYLNERWPDTSAGCLRFLAKIDDINAILVPEIRPLYGTLTAFARRDNSFHGHLPFEGERRVIQIAWVTSAEEAARKSRRGRFSRLVKWLTGRLDTWFGANRDDNAAHRD